MFPKACAADIPSRSKEKGRQQTKEILDENELTLDGG